MIRFQEVALLQKMRIDISKVVISLFLILFTWQVAAYTEGRELTLEDCLELAKGNNPAIKIAESAKERALWSMRETAGGGGVKLRANHINSRSNDSDNSYVRRQKIYNKSENQLVLNYPIYSGGKVEGLTDTAKINLKKADLNLDLTRQQLVLDTTKAYFDALQQRSLVDIQQEAVNNLESHLTIVEDQFKGGLVSKEDVLSSQVQLYVYQDGLIRAKANYENAMDALKTVIGIPLTEKVSIKGDFTCTMNPVKLDECIQYAISCRPESKAVQANIDIAKNNIKVARSGNLPSINLSGTQDWYEQNPPGSKNKNWTVSVTASLNILDAGVTKAQIMQAKTRLSGAKEEARQNQDNVVLEVKQAFNNLTEAGERVEGCATTVERAKENYRITEIGYKAGINSNQNVVDAQQALTQVKTLAVQSLFDYNLSRAQLNKAMGLE